MKKIILAAVAIVGLALSGATIAQATDNAPETQTVWWIVPAGVAPVDNRVGEEGFPQKLTTAGVVPCGQYAQVDVYPADAPVEEWTADGVLTYGEDWGYVETGHTWSFVYGGDCTVPTDEPPVTDEPVDEQVTPTVKESRTVQPTAPSEIQTASK